MTTRKTRGILAVAVIIICIVSVLSFGIYFNPEEGIIYSPTTQTVYTASLTPYYFGFWVHFNPFRKIKRNNIKHIYYECRFSEIIDNKNIFDRIHKNDPNEALRYSRKFRFSPLKISNIFPFVKAKPLSDPKPEELLPTQWKFLSSAEIDETDLSVIDVAIMPDESQSREKVIYLPQCILLQGKAIVFLKNEGWLIFHSTTKE